MPEMCSQLVGEQQKTGLHIMTSVQGEHGLKPQLKLLSLYRMCVAWKRLFQTLCRYLGLQTNNRNHSREVILPDDTKHTVCSLCWLRKTAEIHSFSDLCQSTGERWADVRGKKQVCGSRKAFEVLDCSKKDWR